MFSDGFKRKYTTIPFSTYKNRNQDTATLYSHYHKEIEIITLVDGCCDFYIGSELITLKAGEVLIIPPYAVHRALFSPGTYHECICFDPSILWDEGLRRNLEKGILTIKGHISTELSISKEVYGCARAALAANEKKAPGWELAAIGNLSIIFARLYEAELFVKTDSVDTEQGFVRSVLEYVKEHFAEQITSSTAAEALHINNSYFCRLFKNSFGCCFAEYLAKYRIERSKMLLNMTEDSISDVALKCGFNGFSYFSKIFKETVGKSPSQYRKNKKAKKAADERR